MFSSLYRSATETYYNIGYIGGFSKHSQQPKRNGLIINNGMLREIMSGAGYGLVPNLLLVSLDSCFVLVHSEAK